MLQLPYYHSFSFSSSFLNIQDNADASDERLAAPFMEARWRDINQPLVTKTKLLALPLDTSWGTEMTQFAELNFDGGEGRHVTLYHDALQPDVVIRDAALLYPAFKDNKAAVAARGFAALGQAIESCE